MDNLPFSFFLVSLLVLLVNLIVLLFLCWTVKNTRNMFAQRKPRSKARPVPVGGGAEQLTPDLIQEDGTQERAFLRLPWWKEKTFCSKKKHLTEGTLQELSSPHTASIDQDQTENLPPQESDASEQASTSCQDALNRV
ncbi:uncharacterized protein LOC121635319 isoform X2 [Melanotaenia boesemani]|nr:uncharacterized protein LOC121635319 isoform X2 [Melanotaenia boesemani]